MTSTTLHVSAKIKEDKLQDVYMQLGLINFEIPSTNIIADSKTFHNN